MKNPPLPALAGGQRAPLADYARAIRRIARKLDLDHLDEIKQLEQIARALTARA